MKLRVNKRKENYLTQNQAGWEEGSKSGDIVGEKGALVKDVVD